MSNLPNESIEVREELLKSAQKMKWHTPDGWEVQDLIPVEYVMEVIEALYNQRIATVIDAGYIKMNDLGAEAYEAQERVISAQRTRADINKKEDK